MTFYRVLADLIVVVHFAYILFVVVGMLLILIGIALRWRWVRGFWFRMLHFAAIALVVAESLGGVVCPLTQWEYDLRVETGDAYLDAESGEPASFVGRWVHRLMFFEAPEWVLTVGYCLFGAAVLLTLILAPPRRPWRRSGVD